MSLELVDAGLNIVTLRLRAGLYAHLLMTLCLTSSLNCEPEDPGGGQSSGRLDVDLDRKRSLCSEFYYVVSLIVFLLCSLKEE